MLLRSFWNFLRINLFDIGMERMEKGLFITFEGIDGCGKTTQIELLKKKLDGQNKNYHLLREPGGTETGEKIRQILLDNGETNLQPKTELLLYSASRHQLYNEKIAPILKEGEIAICDRFFDSTVAYQGYGRGLDIDFVDKLNNFVTDGLAPDLTFFLDISIEESHNRLNENSSRDRMENEDKNFYQKVRQGFLELTKSKDRFVKIDGTKSEDKIAKLIWKKIKKEF